VAVARRPLHAARIRDLLVAALPAPALGTVAFRTQGRHDGARACRHTGRWHRRSLSGLLHSGRRGLACGVAGRLRTCILGGRSLRLPSAICPSGHSRLHRGIAVSPRLGGTRRLGCRPCIHGQPGARALARAPVSPRTSTHPHERALACAPPHACACGADGWARPPAARAAAGEGSVGTRRTAQRARSSPGPRRLCNETGSPALRPANARRRERSRAGRQAAGASARALFAAQTPHLHASCAASGSAAASSPPCDATSAILGAHRKKFKNSCFGHVKERDH
jgi:hypothetical protein